MIICQKIKCPDFVIRGGIINSQGNFVCMEDSCHAASPVNKCCLICKKQGCIHMTHILIRRHELWLPMAKQTLQKWIAKHAK